MSLMKAPRLNAVSALALRTILRLSFARAVRAVIEDAVESGQRSEATAATFTILNLVTTLNDHTQLLDVAISMMEEHETESALIPMHDDIFSFYSRVLDLEMSDEALKSLENLEMEPEVQTMREQRNILRKSFDEAMLIDPDEIRRKGGTVTPGNGFVN